MRHGSPYVIGFLVNVLCHSRKHFAVNNRIIHRKSAVNIEIEFLFRHFEPEPYSVNVCDGDGGIAFEVFA